MVDTAGGRELAVPVPPDDTDSIPAGEEMNKWREPCWNKGCERKRHLRFFSASWNAEQHFCSNNKCKAVGKQWTKFRRQTGFDVELAAELKKKLIEAAHPRLQQQEHAFAAVRVEKRLREGCEIGDICGFSTGMGEDGNVEAFQVDCLREGCCKGVWIEADAVIDADGSAEKLSMLLNALKRRRDWAVRKEQGRENVSASTS